METMYPAQYNQEEAHSKKVAAGVTAIILSVFCVGWIGAHKFMLGYQKEGLISLLLSLLCIPMAIFNVIALIEGIIYLTKSDEEFYQTYLAEKKGWF